MEHLFDTVLNGSLSFDGIATAALPPLIVAGGLALLAFILATLAAFQKRPSQQSAKALPNFGTLWILGIAASILSTAQTPTAQAEATHGYRDAGCNCSPNRIPGEIIRTRTQPYIIHMPDTYVPNCKNDYRVSNVRNCESVAYDWHYRYLCYWEDGYWACLYARADDCLDDGVIGGGITELAGLLSAIESKGKPTNWSKLVKQTPYRVVAGFLVGWVRCWVYTEAAKAEWDACATTWSERNWNQWDEFCDALVNIRKDVADEGEFHDCTED